MFTFNSEDNTNPRQVIFLFYWFIYVNFPFLFCFSDLQHILKKDETVTLALSRAAILNTWKVLCYWTVLQTSSEYNSMCMSFSCFKLCVVKFNLPDHSNTFPLCPSQVFRAQRWQSCLNISKKHQTSSLHCKVFHGIFEWCSVFLCLTDVYQCLMISTTNDGSELTLTLTGVDLVPSGV